MRKVSEYRSYAVECRKIATAMHTDEERELMLGVAAAWERLAAERQRSIELGLSPPDDAPTHPPTCDG
jgi:hypothetical protein